jgi:hypothetical protein
MAPAKHQTGLKIPNGRSLEIFKDRSFEDNIFMSN